MPWVSIFAIYPRNIFLLWHRVGQGTRVLGLQLRNFNQSSVTSLSNSCTHFRIIHWIVRLQLNEMNGVLNKMELFFPFSSFNCFYSFFPHYTRSLVNQVVKSFQVKTIFITSIIEDLSSSFLQRVFLFCRTLPSRLEMRILLSASNFRHFWILHADGQLMTKLFLNFSLWWVATVTEFGVPR